MINTIKRWFVWLGHPFLGALTIVAGSIHPVYAICWCWLWITYEKQEYHEITDTCALDLKDFMLGLGIALVAVFIFQVIGKSII